MKRYWIFILAALIAVGAVGIYACREGGFDRGGRGMMMGHGAFGWMGPGEKMFSHKQSFFGGLHLSKEQHGKLMQIISGMEDKMLPLKLEEQKKRIELSELLLNSNPDKQTLSGKLGEMLKLKGEEQAAMLNAFYEINGILRPDQQRTFSHFIARKIAGHGFSSRDGMDAFRH